MSFLLVLLSGVCLLIWAGHYEPNIDFVGLGRYALKFPGGPDTGPLIGVFGSLFTAWIIYPSSGNKR